MYGFFLRDANFGIVLCSKEWRVMQTAKSWSVAVVASLISLVGVLCFDWVALASFAAQGRFLKWSNQNLQRQSEICEGDQRWLSIGVVLVRGPTVGF